MDEFVELFRLIPDYTAMNYYMKTSSILSVMQNAATDDAERRGAGDKNTRDKGFVWMIVRMHIEVIRLPKYKESLQIRTWPSEGKHGMYPRYYEICDSNGNPIISASGIWVLVDIEKRTLLDDVVIDLKGLHTGREIGNPRRIRMPELTQKTSLKAGYTYADINGHINNARYLDLVEDIIGCEYLKNHVVKSIDTDYISEVLPDEMIDISWERQDNAWYFQGDTTKTNFRIRIEYDDIQ